MVGVVQLARADGPSVQPIQGSDVSGPQSVVPAPTKISTRDGKTFLAVKILKVESDDLLIEYGLASGGIRVWRELGLRIFPKPFNASMDLTARKTAEAAGANELRKAAEDGDPDRAMQPRRVLRTRKGSSSRPGTGSKAGIGRQREQGNALRRRLPCQMLFSRTWG